MNRFVTHRAAWYTIITAGWLILIVAFLYSPYLELILSKSHRSISIFAWPDTIDPKFIERFERETRIKVYVNYYEGNDELFTKLKFARGGGYDLIMPSHYMVKSLVRCGFVKKINKEKLSFWRDLDPRFVGLPFDPANEYSIPYIWEVYGLGIDKEFFAHTAIEPSWRLLFDPSLTYRVGMTDEPREITDVVSLYLFGSMNVFNKNTSAQVKQVLLKQKQFVESYTDFALDFLLTSRTCPVVLLSNSFVHRAYKQAPWVELILPKEGTVMTIETLTIAAKSTKEELVYTFINHLFESSVVCQAHELFGNLPTLKKELEAVNLPYIQNSKQLLGSYFNKINPVKPLMPRSKLFALWMDIKAH